jgi:prepilin-type processing-associated H-X9-DG protein
MEPFAMRRMRQRAFTALDLLALIVIAAILGLLIAILMPSLGHSGPAPRSACGATLTGIGKALNLYATENADQFPTVMLPGVLGTYSNQPRPSAATSDAKAVLASYAASPYPQAGDPMACLWMLVLKGNVGPKQFICKSDPAAPTSSDQTDASGNFYDNFGAGPDPNCISYSFAYPWTRDGSGTTVVGNWWRSTMDSSLPLGADMSPLIGTGGKDPTAAIGGDPKIYNSNNHSGGEGQNVLFADAHVEFTKHPYVGQDGDNIWTVGPANKQIPIRTPGITPAPESQSTPFDIIMVPVRDAVTNKL